MICPKCYNRTSVVETKPTLDNDQIRKRRCKSCGYIFYTIESMTPFDDIKSALNTTRREYMKRY